MPVDNLSDRLAALAAQFDAVEPATGSLFEPPPPDDYDGLVHEFDFFEGGQPSQAFVKVRLLTQQSTSGSTQYGGRYAEVVNSLEDPERLPFLKALFDTLATEPGQPPTPYRLTDIAPETPFLISLLDVPVRFRVAQSKKINQETGKPYLNVYVNERTGPPVRQGDVGQRASATPSAGSQVEAELAEQLTQGSTTGEPPTVQGQPLPKVAGCICPAPEKGQFDERCTVPGHGIPF